MAGGLDLAGLLAIWPIAESFAIHTPVGDLITLARTSSSLRASLHGTIPENVDPRRSSGSRTKKSLVPAIGKHQTTDWAHLKAMALFTCSSLTHTRGQKSKPCVYCSKPICDACIVRDSFAHRNENTFKNRLRYFCTDCWAEGRPPRDFRYPASDDEGQGTFSAAVPETEQSDGASSEENKLCECTLKDNGWLCLDCKDGQNTSSAAPTRLLLDPNLARSSVQCYGLDCENRVDLESTEKDRRRVCLWCQRPLRRQYGGEDRYAWNLKTIEARARNAESRSRDVEEYNRHRLKVLRMSRRDMRGTTNPGDEEPIFVRHLDTVNYRNWTAQENVPDPEAVWQSKNGRWRYHQGFLLAVGVECRFVKFKDVNGVDVAELSSVTRGEGGLDHARRNRDLYFGHRDQRLLLKHNPQHHHWNKTCLNELKARVLDAHLVQGLDVVQLTDTLGAQYGVEVSVYEVERQLKKWLDRDDVGSVRDSDSSGSEADLDSSTAWPPDIEQVAVGPEGDTSPEEQGPLSPEVGGSFGGREREEEEQQQREGRMDESIVVMDNLVDPDPPPALGGPVAAATDQRRDDPPPYEP